MPVTELKPYVRPWALATPVLVLVICLPLLRPLRHPGDASVDEELRLATVSALVEHHSGPLASRLAIDQENIDMTRHVIRVGGHLYSDQPPMLAFLLSGVYRVLHAMGYGLKTNNVLVPYLLTLVGVTLPAAGAAGLVYRMGRIFELRRQVRTALAAAVVFATGMVSYAVVLNAHVPAAAMVLASAGCLMHVARSPQPARAWGWIFLGGICAALGATIDLPAAVFLILFLIVAAVLPLSPLQRSGAVLVYLIGAAAPILLHATMTVPLTGNILPGALNQNLLAHTVPNIDDPSDESDDPSAAQGFWAVLGRGIGRFLEALVGNHGLLVHFPAILLGIIGVLAVMHRHWPASVKALAAAAALAMLLALVTFTFIRQGTATADFANRWLMVFVPILFFFTGAWLRRPHRPVIWAAAAVLLTFSVLVSLIGATNPMPPDGYDRYTPIAALAGK